MLKQSSSLSLIKKSNVPEIYFVALRYTFCTKVKKTNKKMGINYQCDETLQLLYTYLVEGMTYHSTHHTRIVRLSQSFNT